jgi:hypothetical protein
MVVVDAVEEDENTSGASTKDRSANRSKKKKKLLGYYYFKGYITTFNCSRMNKKHNMQNIDDEASPEVSLIFWSFKFKFPRRVSVYLAL